MDEADTDMQCIRVKIDWSHLRPSSTMDMYLAVNGSPKLQVMLAMRRSAMPLPPPPERL